MNYDNSTEVVKEIDNSPTKNNIDWELKSYPKTCRYQIDSQSPVKDRKYMMISSNYQAEDRENSPKRLRNSDIFSNGLHATETISSKNEVATNDCFDIEDIIK